MSFFRSRWVKAPDAVEERDPAELADGFRASGVACGIKDDARPDLGIVLCEDPAAASSALLTSNAAAAAPIRLCRERVRLEEIRAVVANSGNANAATGAEGREAAIRMQGRAAEACGVEPARVAVASTGVIGVPLPAGRAEAGIAAAAARLDRWGGSRFAEAILTTDSAPKACSVVCDGVTISAQAKGGGMIHPRFATTLCFVQTDAVLPDPAGALRRAASRSFERITVDGQQSTNDAIFLIANGVSGRELPEGLLETVLLQLALDVVADGEGATRVARIEVEGADTEDEADRVARTVANSPLVQTALYGRDPNWGRVVQAAGMALAGEDVEIGADDVEAEELGGDASEPGLRLVLGRGERAAHIYFSDLNHRYVEINAEYVT